MSYDFLVPVSTWPDPTPSAGLQRALDLAASIAGRLSVLVHEVDIPPVRNVFAETLLNVSAMESAAERRSREVGEALSREIRHLADRLKLPVEVARLRCRPEQAEQGFARAARTQDATLMVLDPEAPAQGAIARAILFDSGGPLLLCPGQEGPGHLFTVAIAWDGSRAAARAVRDAMPLLRNARSTLVLTVGDDKEVVAESIAGLRAWLGHHGIAARHITAERGTAPVGDTLQEAALREDAGLLVMGGYGHNRVRELILGGATRTILGAARMPVFLSH